MTNYVADYTYIESDATKLFTIIMLPNEKGKFPIVAMRSPYVDKFENTEETDIAVEYMSMHKNYLKNGYAVIFQHCRGRGKSDGDCVPYINERKDSLAMLDWIRKQDFYNGEIYLKGQSYTSTLWYAAAPFADDIKGAVFAVQDSERYNVCYRNGFLKKGLHAKWYVTMYKAKSHMKKNYTPESFNLLPLKDFTKTVFGEEAPDFDEMLRAPKKTDPFWNTHTGGADTRGATENVNFPILFTTAFYDIYTGGIFDMWNNMSEKNRNRSALVVSPYSHSDIPQENSITYPNGRKVEKFGENTDIEWFDHIRGKRKESPFKQGEITYYRIFENRWATDLFYDAENTVTLPLGEEEISYVYNPYDAPTFKGGLSAAFGGSVFQDEPNSRHDIISVYTAPFEKEIFVKGKMKAKLRVKSDCEDTCFYIRISIEKEQGDLGLRDDITSLCYQIADYIPSTFVDLDFSFDEHAFLIKKGERLRIDIASADNDHYIRHTNNKGLYSEQITAKIANNTVSLGESFLTLPTE